MARRPPTATCRTASCSAPPTATCRCCYVRVTNLDNGLETIVRVNDRGPFGSDRLIDLSHAAAKQLEMVEGGEARVRVELINDTPTRW